MSTDEKTRIQALEYVAPTKPAVPGRIESVEFEYIRHGTLCLMPSFNVATGEIDAFTIGATRSEQDFAGHIAASVNTDPAGAWTRAG